MVGIAAKLPNQVAFRGESWKRQGIGLWQSKPPCSRWITYSAAEATAAAKVQREEIYYATFPLVGMESLEGALVFSGRELPKVLAQHCAIIVERPSEGVRSIAPQHVQLVGRADLEPKAEHIIISVTFYAHLQNYSLLLSLQLAAWSKR